MTTWYNDHDAFVCAWLEKLIGARLLPEGKVDGRSVLEVVPADLGSFRQCHFFAGIGGWPRALELAGWPDDREVWTASLPCQPLSVAGQRRGDADERHLWPAFYRLVAERRPATLLGEQVASKDGREWFAGIRADLEGAGYACGAAVMPACAVGAPHRRERLFWVADRSQPGCEAWRGDGIRIEPDDRQGFAARDGGAGRLSEEFASGRNGGFWSDAIWLAGADGKARRVVPSFCGLATGLSDRLDPRWLGGEGEPVPLLVEGFPNRVGLLRGYGNSIVAPLAAEFVKAFLDGP